MKKNYFLPIFICLFISTLDAKASSDFKLSAEPFLGYGLSSLKNSDNSSNISLNGYQMGTRALVHYQDYLFIGPEFNYSLQTPSVDDRTQNSIEKKFSISSINTSGHRFTLGLIGGIRIPLTDVRFYLGYQWIDQQSFSFGGNPSKTTEITLNEKLEGHSFKLGVSYQLLRMLTVNLEHWRASYSTATEDLSIKINGTEGLTSNKHDYKDKPLTSSTWLLTVSAPLSLFSF